MNTNPLTSGFSRGIAKSRKAHRMLTGVMISFGTVLLCVFGIELAGYIWEHNTAQGQLGWTLVASRRMDLVRRGTDERPYYLFQPNEEYLWEGIPVNINSLGFRNEEFNTFKPTGVYRILNIGDSVAFGWEIHQEDTYGKQLERMLNNRNDGNRYEVINAAIPAWNLEAERNFLLQEGLGYQPDLVLLDLTLVNDIYGHGPALSEKQTVFQWLRDYTYGWPFLTTQVRFILAKHRGPEAIPVLNPPRNADAYYPLDEKSPVWDEIWNLIVEIKQACQERKIEFILVVFPTAFQLNSAEHPDVPQRVLEERAALADIELVDLLPAYREACDKESTDACEGYENLLFADVWMHPNTEGHQIAAHALSDKIGLSGNSD